jgi:hypothetical protein
MVRGFFCFLGGNNLKLKYLLTTLAVITLMSLFSVTCFAANNANYEIRWSYTVTNTTDTDFSLVPFQFDSAILANESSYQPDTAFTRTLDGAEAEIVYSVYKTMPAHTSRIVTDSWTFANGAFDQYPVQTETYANALKAYKFVTENIVYGEPQSYALPEIATCETFASAFCDLLTDEEIRYRKVYGYALRLVDKNGDLTFGKSDITEKSMHVWVEWYDDESGEWIFCDPTFDAGKAEFEFFGKCPENSPHLAMYYDFIPLRYVSANHDITWTKTVTLYRSEYIDADENAENLLEAMARLENEVVILSEYAESKGLTFTLNRAANMFSLQNSCDFFVPPSFSITVDDFGDLNITSGNTNIRMQFSKKGAMRLWLN